MNIYIQEIPVLYVENIIYLQLDHFRVLGHIPGVGGMVGIAHDQKQKSSD